MKKTKSCNFQQGLAIQTECYRAKKLQKYLSKSID